MAIIGFTYPEMKNDGKILFIFHHRLINGHEIHVAGLPTSIFSSGTTRLVLNGIVW